MCWCFVDQFQISSHLDVETDDWLSYSFEYVCVPWRFCLTVGLMRDGASKNKLAFIFSVFWNKPQICLIQKSLYNVNLGQKKMVVHKGSCYNSEYLDAEGDASSTIPRPSNHVVPKQHGRCLQHALQPTTGQNVYCVLMLFLLPSFQEFPTLAPPSATAWWVIINLNLL